MPPTTKTCSVARRVVYHEDVLSISKTCSSPAGLASTTACRLYEDVHFARRVVYLEDARVPHEDMQFARRIVYDEERL